MNRDQCLEEDVNIECPHDVGGHEVCRSGVIDRQDDDKCNDTPPDTTLAPPITTESPYTGKCSGPIDTSEVDPFKHFQRWECYKPGHTHETIDMYTATEMPTGGYCELVTETSGSCKDASYRYTCDPVDQENSNWAGPAGQDDEGLTADKTKLKKLGCKAQDLTIEADLVDQAGRRFSCVNGGMNAQNNIPAENDCLMLCDNYPVLTFFTDFQGTGSRGWFYEVFDNAEITGPLNPGMLDCWGKKYLN